MTNSENPETTSQNNFIIDDNEVRVQTAVPRFSKVLPKEEMKGLAAMSAEEAFYHLQILPSRDNFKPKLSVECANYPNGCATCCNKVFADKNKEKLTTCNFGKHMADTIEPMVLSMLEESE